MRKGKLKHQHSPRLWKQTACADFLISTLYALLYILNTQHFFFRIITSISDWEHTTIVTVIIGMCLLLRRRPVSASAFKLRGRDPFRLSVRVEWWQEVHWLLLSRDHVCAFFLFFHIHDPLLMPFYMIGCGNFRTWMIKERKHGTTVWLSLSILEMNNTLWSWSLLWLWPDLNKALSHGFCGWFARGNEWLRLPQFLGFGSRNLQ